MQPKQKTFFFWKLVQRENAARFMLISLLSSVATVTFIRSFLALTGYPQIGNDSLHIAHVLWGGLILYAAAILPLIFLNPRLHLAGAVLSGIGAGFFIDEVGKFITRQNDYFTPAAAPIIYVFFLFVLILVILVRRPGFMDGRAELVQALEMVREQLYRPLDETEKASMEQDMARVMESDPNDMHRNLARQLMELVRSDSRPVPKRIPSWWLRIAEKIESWMTEPRLAWLVGLGMTLLGMVTLNNPLQAGLKQSMPSSWLFAFLHAYSGRLIATGEVQRLYAARLWLEVIIGIMLLVSAFLLAAGRKRQAFDLGYLSLLLSLTVLDMVLFYFEQFSTVSIVLLQFTVLGGVVYYRNQYLKRKNSL